MRPILRPVLALAVAIALVGCSGCATTNSGLKAHTVAAQTLDEIADDAKEIALEQREAELTAVADQAKAEGVDASIVRARIEEAAARYDAGPVIPAVNAFVAAKDLYVRAVLQAASKDTPTWTEAKAMLKDVVDAYTNLRDALGKPDKMPELPDAIAKLLTRAPRPGGEPVEAVA